MKGADRVFATCTVAGAIVAFLVWFTWDLPWQGLGIGFFAGLILYERMTRPAAHETFVSGEGRPNRKPDRVKEDEIIGLG